MQFEPNFWELIPHSISSVPAKTTLLEAGHYASRLFVIKAGTVRMWFNQDGKDVTLQFFFEGSPVCSFESFLKGIPSDFNIETIEPSDILIIEKDDILAFLESHPQEKERTAMFLIDRMIYYIQLFLSRIKDNPQKRYENLIQENPEILRRVPQHYIASYLGITPVSLSRIRARSLT
jgi:CRP-like cAMP-binding protein